MGLKLYKKDTSAPCRSVYMVIEILNIPNVEYINMDLAKREHFKEEFLKLNPQHTVPTLVDGDFAIWDSHAINTYLVNQYAKDDSLYPTEPKRRAVVDQRLHFDNAILFSALRESMITRRNISIMAFWIPILYHGETQFRPENLEKIKSGYEFIEKFFNGPWLAGDSITVADICSMANISGLNEILPIDKALYPKLTVWFEQCSKQDFYVKANVPGLRIFQDFLKNAIH